MYKLLTFCLCFLHLFSNAQSIMNIYQCDGNVLNISTACIDSITYSTTPVVRTTSITSISSHNATCQGEVVLDAGYSVTDRGFCYAQTSHPTLTDSIIHNGNGLGIFMSNLNNLMPNTTYYIRAYAVNVNGVSYGNELFFTTMSGNLYVPGNGVSDINGNTYSTIILGSQEWFAENLRAESYSNSDPIPNISTCSGWNNLIGGAWAYYNNDTAYNIPYGKLYNGYTILDSRKICPIGWHVPTKAEWDSLITYLGNFVSLKMKVTGSQYWDNTTHFPTNESGFSAYAGGKRSSGTGCQFGLMGTRGQWWTNTDIFGNGLSIQSIYIDGSSYQLPDFSDESVKTAFSIRCLKD